MTTAALRSCEVCGRAIAPKPGYPAKVCSDECRRIRNSQREKVRYQRVKNTEEWQSTREAYIKALKAKSAADPAFAAQQIKSQRARVRKSRLLLAQDPVRLEVYREKKRQWFLGLSPLRREQERERNRAWYRSLTREEKILHYYEAVRTRALQSLLALGEDLEKIKGEEP